MSRVLFVLKRRENYDPIKHNEISLQCGLYNSIYYVHNMLISQNIEYLLFSFVSSLDSYFLNYALIGDVSL